MGACDGGGFFIEEYFMLLSSSIRVKTLFSSLLLLGLTACMTPPPTIVQQPMSARPVQTAKPPAANGAIFQAQSAQGLFADRTPSQVGDLITVVIEERASTSNSENTSGSRSAGAEGSVTGFDLPFFPGWLERRAGDLSLGFNTSSNAGGKGSSSASSSFSTNITVTVTEVLSNGNLQVSGEKQVRMNGEMQFIRLSGVVNPRDVRIDNRLGGNVVSSLKMADARIEQINRGNNHSFAQPGWLTRFFMSVFPF